MRAAAPDAKAPSRAADSVTPRRVSRAAQPLPRPASRDATVPAGSRAAGGLLVGQPSR